MAETTDKPSLTDALPTDALKEAGQRLLGLLVQRAAEAATDRVSGLSERLTGAGAPVRWDDRLEGVRRFYTEDPWGNRIEICVPA